MTVLPDRALVVPQGQRVVTDYVSVWDVKLACRDRMSVASVEKKMRELMQLRGGQLHPPPNGYWDGETFVLEDGRHTYIAAVMLGYSYLLVAWVEAS